MALPIVVLPIDEKWDCHQCGACCKSSVVDLNEQDVARLKSLKWDAKSEFDSARTIVRVFGFKKRYRLAQKEDGSCVFLDSSGRCHIHSQFGMNAKPLACRVFPFQLVPRSGKVVLTVRRSCPSAAADLGAPLQNKLEETKQLVRDGQLSSLGIDPPDLKSGEQRGWDVIERALKSIENLILDQRYPPVRRIVHAAQFAKLLSDAKTKSMTAKQLFELFDALEEVVPEESRIYFQERQQPSATANLLFRSMALEFARLNPQYQHQGNWTQRVQLGRSFFQLTRGSGHLPQMAPLFPAAMFSELESPLGNLDAAIDLALARLIETSAASYLYAITDRQGWSVVDSIRGLVVAFPVGLWLLRWASKGRGPTSHDMLPIVVALSRGSSSPQLIGNLQKRRLQLLATNGDLERLAVWYAR